MIETLKNPLLQNQESFGAESWYIASRTEVYQVYLNDDRKLTADLFYGKVKFATPCIHIGKILLEKSFSQNVLKTNA